MINGQHESDTELWSHPDDEHLSQNKMAQNAIAGKATREDRTSSQSQDKPRWSCPLPSTRTRPRPSSSSFFRCHVLERNRNEIPGYRHEKIACLSGKGDKIDGRIMQLGIVRDAAENRHESEMKDEEV